MALVVEYFMPQVRGTLGSLNQLVICIGILAALLTNIVVPATEWAIMFYVAAIPAALLAIGEPPECQLISRPLCITYPVSL